MPPVADQVIPVLVVPLTVAVNCWVVPVCTDAESGLIATLITGDAAVTVMVAVPDFVVSATLVAMIAYVPALAGAVKSPEEEMVPPEADHATALLVVPLTVAENCWLPPV